MIDDSADLPRIVRFMIELDKLKAVLRKTKPVGFERYENSAEHSWQICVLACLLGRFATAPVNIARVVELLLVHDIPEIDAGDQIVYDAPSASRIASELEAAQRIFGLLPDDLEAWCMAAWQEFEARQTPEAVYARAVDRLMPVLHNLHANGGSWREHQISQDAVLAVNAVIGEACP